MSLYETLLETLNGHRYSNYFVCSCQWHGSDTHPSMFVYEDGNFRCATCGKYGTLTYLNKYLGGHGAKATPKANVVLPRWKEWEDKYGDLEGIARHAHESCKRYPDWMWYFKERKIDNFFEQGMFGMIGTWALFPVINPKGKIENIVVRNTKGNGTRYVIKKIDEQKPLLYCPNWQRVQNSDTVYVPFGIVDSWAFEAINLASVTGITGKSLSVELLKPLGKYIVFVPDEYEETEAHQLANKLGWRAKVKRISYLEDTKDPDGIRKNFGNAALLHSLGVSV